MPTRSLESFLGSTNTLSFSLKKPQYLEKQFPELLGYTIYIRLLGIAN